MSGYLHRLDREKRNTDFIMIGGKYDKFDREKKDTGFIMIGKKI